MNGAHQGQTLDEFTPGVFLCVGCGAQVSFEAEEDVSKGTPLQRATCAYCAVVNDRVLALLRKESARERHEARLRAERRKTALVLAGVATLSVLMLLVGAAASTHGELRTAYAEVTRARAQVENVRERQVAVTRRLAGTGDSAEREAELSGAENRVRIERARYDVAAAAYNAVVGSPWSGLCARLFGLPARAPLSNEAHW